MYLKEIPCINKVTIPKHMNFCVEFLRGNSYSEPATTYTSAKKRWKFWRQTHTPLWDLIGRIIFFRAQKKPRSRFWLARTYVRLKTYDGAFPWIFLSMYIMNFWKHIFDRQQLTWSRAWAEYRLHENLDTLLWTAMYFGKTFTTSLAINRDNN